MKTMSRAAIAKRYGVEYTTAFHWTKLSNFPESVGKRKHGALVWNANEVYDWARRNRPNNRLVKVISPDMSGTIVKPVIKPSKSTLDVILFLLENDKDKQKLVLDILLD
jgi:hypothetical protein